MTTFDQWRVFLAILLEGLENFYVLLCNASFEGSRMHWVDVFDLGHLEAKLREADQQ